eukprot:5553564-Pleurochrysis_carterae.AAC.4
MSQAGVRTCCQTDVHESLVTLQSNSPSRLQPSSPNPLQPACRHLEGHAAQLRSPNSWDA